MTHPLSSNIFAWPECRWSSLLVSFFFISFFLLHFLRIGPKLLLESSSTPLLLPRFLFLCLEQNHLGRKSPTSKVPPWLDTNLFMLDLCTNCEMVRSCFDVDVGAILDRNHWRVGLARAVWYDSLRRNGIRPWRLSNGFVACAGWILRLGFGRL